MEFNEQIEIATISSRRLTKLKFPDAIIAATALALGAPLLTFDRRLAAIDWPELRIIIPS